MARRSIRNPRHFPLSKPIQIQHSFLRLSSHYANNSPPSSPTGAAGFSFFNLAHQLLDQFSKPNPHRDPTVLSSLALNLSPEAVENAIKHLRNWRSAHDLFHWAASQPGFRHTCYTFNALAESLSRSRQSTPLKNLVKETIECRCPTTSGALGFFIRCLGERGLVDEAVALFDSAGQLYCFPNSYAYNCLLEVLAKSGRVEMMESRFLEMVEGGRVPDKYTMTAVLQCYCNVGELEKVLDVLNKITENGWVDQYVLTLLIVSFCKWGKVDKAFELVEKMEGFGMRPSEKTFCVLVHGFVKEKRVDRALDIFEKMKKWGFSADLALVSVLIEGLCKERQLERALGLYLDMKKNGVHPDVPLISKIISSFCAEGHLVDASRLLEEEGKVCESSSLVLLCNAVLDGLVRCHEVDRAHKLLREMMNSQELHLSSIQSDLRDSEADADQLFFIKEAVCPNADSFYFVISGLCKSQKLDMALLLLDDMIEMGCRGKMTMYNNLIYELCHSDRLEDSYAVLRKMKELGFAPSEFTNNSLFYCLCRRGNMRDILELLRAMRQQGHVPWIKYCTMMVQQLCENGKVAEALKFCHDMTEIGFLPDMIAYSAAIDGLCMIGDVDGALRLFREVLSCYYLPDVVVHNVLMNGFNKAGRITEAQKILKEMLEKGLVPSVVTYNLMIDGWCKAEKCDEALSCFSKMIEETKSPTVITYTSLIDGMLNAGRVDDAIGFWNKMKENGCAPNKITYMAIVHGLCRCGRVESAFSYFLEMKEKGLLPDTFTYLLLIDSVITGGNPVKAFELFKEVIRNYAFLSTNSKKYTLLRKVASKLYEDPSTSLDMRKLIDDGSVPLIRNVNDITAKPTGIT